MTDDTSPTVSVSVKVLNGFADRIEALTAERDAERALADQLARSIALDLTGRRAEEDGLYTHEALAMWTEARRFPKKVTP